MDRHLPDREPQAESEVLTETAKQSKNRIHYHEWQGCLSVCGPQCSAGDTGSFEENELSIEDIDWFVLHQANARIVDAVARRLRLDIGKFPMNLQDYGNTSSASIPILLNELNREGYPQGKDRNLFWQVLGQVFHGEQVSWNGIDSETK